MLSPLGSDPLALLFQPEQQALTLVQGISGRMGRKHSALMRAYGTRIVAGVAPANSRAADLSDIDGVPVFKNCAAAVSATGAVASVILVPPFEVLPAIREAIAAGLRLLVSVTEGMPTADAVQARNLVRAAGARWIGASTPGVAVPGRLKLGFIPDVSLRPGTVGVMAKSGTLSYEVNYRLVAAGLGQSVWVGVGGDAVKGTRFADLLPHFMDDPQTQEIVVIGEIGGTEEEELANALISLRPQKPVYALIAGRSAREGVVMGHAGAVVHGGTGSIESKSRALRAANAQVFETIDALVRAVAASHRSQPSVWPPIFQTNIRRDFVEFKLSEQQRQFIGAVRELTQKEFKPRALQFQDGTFPMQNMKQLAKIGVLGMTVPEEYGGLGLPVLDTALILEEIAKGCYVTAMAVLGEAGVQTRIIATYAPESIKRRILPAIGSGDCILAICMTEPHAGTDVANYKTNTRLKNDRATVNGVKTLISRAPEAGMFVVFTRIDDAPGRDGIGCVLIERGTPGLEVTASYHTMGGEFLHEVRFDNCEVPVENVVLRKDGFRKLLSAFNTQRCLNPSISLGLAEGAFDESVKYLRDREVHGKPLSEFQGMRWKLAEMYRDIEAARSVLYRACATANPFPEPLLAAVAKITCNEMSLRVTSEAIQIHGGYGFTDEYPVSRLYRGARYGSLGGGTTETLKELISKRVLDGATDAEGLLALNTF